MSLKFALLGLVALRPRSGYDIKRVVDRSIFYIWNVTATQIYNALRALRDEGLITSESVPQQGKPDKQIHTITDKGREILETFANEPIREEMVRDKVLLRIFFGNFADSERIEEELSAYLQRIREEQDYLHGVEQRVLAHPGTQHEARRYQLLSLRLKVAQLRATEEELKRFGVREPGQLDRHEPRVSAARG